MPLTFLESLKNLFLINVVTNLKLSVKIATLGLLKKQVFGNKSNHVTIFAHDVNNKILSRDVNSPQNSPWQSAMTEGSAEGFAKTNSVLIVITSTKILPR